MFSLYLWDLVASGTCSTLAALGILQQSLWLLNPIDTSYPQYLTRNERDMMGIVHGDQSELAMWWSNCVNEKVVGQSER